MDYLIFSGSSNLRLAEDIARLCKHRLGALKIEKFPDGEIGIEIQENVRGRDVFIIQSIAYRPNHYLMELLLIADALKRASAKTIVAIIPYFAYARQDKRGNSRSPISARLVADLLQRAGIGHVVTMDLHTEQIQGFFDIPVDNLSGRKVLLDGVLRLKLKNLAVVAPDVGASKMGRRFAKELGVDLAIVDKQRVTASKVKGSAIIGDIKGKDVVIVDDICATGGTLRTASSLCKEAGAKGIVVVVTHAIFAGNAAMDGIDKILVTDTIPQTKKEKVEVISVAGLFSKAIECITLSQSVSALSS